MKKKTVKTIAICQECGYVRIDDDFKGNYYFCPYCLSAMYNEHLLIDIDGELFDREIYYDKEKD